MKYIKMWVCLENGEYETNEFEKIEEAIEYIKEYTLQITSITIVNTDEYI